MSKHCKYIGTLAVPGRGPMDVMIDGHTVVIFASFARRKNRLVKAVDFLKACRLWWRVQRLGSRA